GGVADTDVDNLTRARKSAAKGNSVEPGAGSAGNDNSALVGPHGTLTIHSHGSYSYAVDNSDAVVHALNSGNTTTDTFTYPVKARGGVADAAQVTVAISGADDAAVGKDDAGAAIEARGTGDARPGANASGKVVVGALDGGVADTDVDNLT